MKQDYRRQLEEHLPEGWAIKKIGKNEWGNLAVAFSHPVYLEIKINLFIDLAGNIADILHLRQYIRDKVEEQGMEFVEKV